jgi:hypothetical protein
MSTTTARSYALTIESFAWIRVHSRFQQLA